MCGFNRSWKMHSIGGFLWKPRWIIEWDLVLLDRMISEKEKVLCTTQYDNLRIKSAAQEWSKAIWGSSETRTLSSFYLICCLLRRWKYCAAVVGCTTSQFTLSPSALLTGLRFYIRWFESRENWKHLQTESTFSLFSWRANFYADSEFFLCVSN